MKENVFKTIKRKLYENFFKKPEKKKKKRKKIV